MKYWDEMQDKFGFSDGSSIPPDARVCRELYVRVINRLCEKRGLPIRAESYDRPGLHNWCMIVMRNLNGHRNEWADVFTEALEMQLDDYIRVEVTVAEDEVTDLFTNHPELQDDQ